MARYSSGHRPHASEGNLETRRDPGPPLGAASLPEKNFTWPLFRWRQCPYARRGRHKYQEVSWTSSRGCFSPREEFHLARVLFAPVPARLRGADTNTRRDPGPLLGAASLREKNFTWPLFRSRQCPYASEERPRGLIFSAGYRRRERRRHQKIRSDKLACSIISILARRAISSVSVGPNVPLAVVLERRSRYWAVNRAAGETPVHHHQGERLGAVTSNTECVSGF